MKEKFYKISKKESFYIARLNYQGEKFDFKFDPDIKCIKQMGIAILGKHYDNTYTLYFPIEFKGLNAKENIMYAFISGIERYQYESGVLIVMKDYNCSLVNIDRYAAEYERIMKSYVAHSKNISKNYLENILKDFSNYKMTTTMYFSERYPYIKGSYYEKGSFIINIDGLDYAASPYEHESDVFPLPEYEIKLLGETEYLIPQSLIKVTNADGNVYIASKSKEIKLYDKITELEDYILFKMQPALGFHYRKPGEDYKGYSFIKDGKIAKIAIFSTTDKSFCYEISFEEYKDFICLDTLKFIKKVCFETCSSVDIWRFDNYSGKTFLIMKHKNEQQLISEI